MRASACVCICVCVYMCMIMCMCRWKGFLVFEVFEVQPMRWISSEWAVQFLNCTRLSFSIEISLSRFLSLSRALSPTSIFFFFVECYCLGSGGRECDQPNSITDWNC